MASLILTVIGPDRPGLVRALAEAVAAHGGSWLESRMARLAGQFAGIALVDAPESLLADLQALEGQGLRILVQSGAEQPAATAREPRLALEVVGNDRPGIVRDITRILWDCGVNIEEFVTGASWRAAACTWPYAAPQDAPAHMGRARRDWPCATTGKGLELYGSHSRRRHT